MIYFFGRANTNRKENEVPAPMLKWGPAMLRPYKRLADVEFAMTVTSVAA